MSGFFLLPFGFFEPVTFTLHFDDVASVREPVEGRAGESFAAQDLSPLLEGQVCGDHDAGPFVCVTDDVEEQFGPYLGSRYVTQFVQGQRVVSMPDITEPPKIYSYDLAGRMLSEMLVSDPDQEPAETGVNPVLDFVYLGNHRVAVLTGTINPGDVPSCFIASAAYGTPMAVDIHALRDLRERVLKKFQTGRSFVEWYSGRGPRYARWLDANSNWKPIVRVGLIVPVGLSKVGFYGNGVVVILLMGMCVFCIVFIGRRLGWKWRNIALGAFFLTFGAVMVYSFLVDIPEARATRSENNTKLQHEGVYFLYEDHIGRPVLVTEYTDAGSNGYEYDSNGDYYWKADYMPFGQVYDDNDSAGIPVGTGNNHIDWAVPFRFPGQYEDPELNGLLFYNHHRWYSPDIGRYNRADPINKGFHLGTNLYSYVSGNPIIYSDINGLETCFEFPMFSTKAIKLRTIYDPDIWILAGASLNNFNSSTCTCQWKKYDIYIDVFRDKLFWLIMHACICPDKIWYEDGSKWISGEYGIAREPVPLNVDNVRYTPGFAIPVGFLKFDCKCDNPPK